MHLLCSLYKLLKAPSLTKQILVFLSTKLNLQGTKTWSWSYLLGSDYLLCAMTYISIYESFHICGHYLLFDTQKTSLAYPVICTTCSCIMYILPSYIHSSESMKCTHLTGLFTYTYTIIFIAIIATLEARIYTKLAT